MNRLAKIDLFLSETEDQQFVQYFFGLLSSISTSTTLSETQCFVPTYPKDSSPAICLSPSSYPNVTIRFQDTEMKDIIQKRSELYRRDHRQ